jgi:hypothetical protein
MELKVEKETKKIISGKLDSSYDILRLKKKKNKKKIKKNIFKSLKKLLDKK